MTAFRFTFEFNEDRLRRELYSFRKADILKHSLRSFLHIFSRESILCDGGVKHRNGNRPVDSAGLIDSAGSVKSGGPIDLAGLGRFNWFYKSSWSVYLASSVSSTGSVDSAGLAILNGSTDSTHSVDSVGSMGSA